MFKHLLLPTDGSRLADTAVLEGLRLARSMQARVTAIHVMPEFHVLTYRSDMLKETREQFHADCRLQADRILATVTKAASEEGVACEVTLEVSDHPYEAIIATAAKRGCDLIVMGSHGQRGARALLLGSETHKVLTHTKIPVLVYR